MKQSGKIYVESLKQKTATNSVSTTPFVAQSRIWGVIPTVASSSSYFRVNWKHYVDGCRQLTFDWLILVWRQENIRLWWGYWLDRLLFWAWGGFVSVCQNACIPRLRFKGFGEWQRTKGIFLSPYLPGSWAHRKLGRQDAASYMHFLNAKSA